MYNRILVPMEHEQHQEPALVYAQTLAQRTGATVVLAWLVPVVASEEHFFRQVQVEPGSSGARRRAEGEAFLEEATRRLRAGAVEVVPKVLVTPLPPERAIVELAVQERADLIIMTTLPRSAVGRFLFGSVGEKVRRRSPIPVLFVNTEQQGGGPGQAGEGQG
jgi:nucleotide-binding universal stress UspA family protein